MRRMAIRVGAAMLAMSCAAAWADDVMYVTWQGGSREKIMKEDIFPRFQAKFPVRLQYIAATSTETLAKLQAQRANQQIDVVLMDDGPLYQANAIGLCANQRLTSGQEKLYDVATMPATHAIGVGVVATGLAYNTKYFSEKGWAPPTSWRDIEDPKYKNKLSVLSISNTMGLHALLMEARLNGGSEQNMDPGFKAFSQRIAPNIRAWVQTTGNLSSEFQNGEIAIAVWANGRTQALADTGFPVKFVYPKEGAVATLIGACVVQKPTVSKYSAEFVRFLLTPEIQQLLAEKEGLAPVNKDTKVSERVAEQIPFGEARMKSLITVNWTVANQNRTAWSRRWMREVEAK